MIVTYQSKQLTECNLVRFVRLALERGPVYAEPLGGDRQRILGAYLRDGVPYLRTARSSYPWSDDLRLDNGLDPNCLLTERTEP